MRLTFDVLQLPAADRVHQLLDDVVVGVVKAEQLGCGGVLLLSEKTREFWQTRSERRYTINIIG